MENLPCDKLSLAETGCREPLLETTVVLAKSLTTLNASLHVENACIISLSLSPSLKLPLN